MSPPLFFLLLLLSILHCASARGGDVDSGSVTHDLKSGSLIVVKLWCLVIVFAGTFAGGMSPYFLRWKEGFLVLGTQFAGGVFLGTSLMHFLSDSNKTFEDLTTKEYPFAFMLACSGYLLTMLADCVVVSVYGKGKEKEVAGGATGGDDLDLPGALEHGKHSHNVTSSHSESQVHGTKHDHSSIASLATVTSFGDTIMLIVALCFHSFFEGIAIGVAETKAEAWRAMWTVSLHKIFASVAMGIALLRMLPNRPFLSCVAYSFAFAISSPIGVAVGIVIDATTQGVVADWMFAVSMGVACGVFVYVSVNHLLSKGYAPEKRSPVDAPHYKLLAVMLGIGVIAVVMIWDT